MTNQTVKEPKKRSHWDPRALENNLNIIKQVRKITKERMDQGDTPFLSVIIRTQGKRFEALKEALLCLEAQTDDRFEVHLILHKATDEGKAATKRQSLQPQRARPSATHKSRSIFDNTHPLRAPYDTKGLRPLPKASLPVFPTM